MSIIQDALKKAQEDRKKKNSSEVPYHLSGVQKRSKTVTITVYITAGFCVAAVLAWLYIPYFHKPKQTIIQPVAVQPSVQPKPAPATVSTHSVSESQKQAKETSEKRDSGIEKRLTLMTPNNRQKPADTKNGIAQIRKIAVSPPKETKVRTAELMGKEDITNNEPVRTVEKKTDDGNIDRMYNEALKEQQSGRTKEAKAQYKQILAKQPDHIETMNNLGVIAIYEGNTQEALFYFKRILEYRKSYSKAYNNIGLIALRDGDRQLAEEYLRKAISLEPDDPGPYVNLSALLRSQGKLQEASKLLEMPIQKKMKDPDLLLSYAVIKDTLGQFEDAARYYRQYLSLQHNPVSKKDIIERLQYIAKKMDFK